VSYAQQADVDNAPEVAEVSDEELAENPGGPDDDSYIHPETLRHRTGYTERPDFGSAANTINQLEEDDRVKEPIIRFPRIDESLKSWFEMKRRLNEESGIQFGFDYNSLYQSASKALTVDDSGWSSVFRLIRQWSDVFGVGLNWGQPPDWSLSDQLTVEVVYRMQLSQNLQLTPSLQYLRNPALNQEHSSIWVAGLRMQLSL
jgi:hypothetical protein